MHDCTHIVHCLIYTVLDSSSATILSPKIFEFYILRDSPHLKSFWVLKMQIFHSRVQLRQVPRLTSCGSQAGDHCLLKETKKEKSLSIRTVPTLKKN